MTAQKTPSTTNETFEDATSSISEFHKMDKVALSDTIVALSSIEQRTYKGPACAQDFTSEEIYTNYITAGRDRTRDFFKRFAQRCSMCGDDFVLNSLLTLDRFMATYEPYQYSPEKCIDDKEWYLIVVTVLQLTIKMNCPPGYEGPTLETYAKFYGNLFNADDLRAMEFKILKVLSYHVTPPVYRHFVHFFAPFLDCTSHEVEEEIVRNAMDIATTEHDDEWCITSVEFMGHEQSCVAFACMRLAMEQDERISHKQVLEFKRKIDAILNLLKNGDCVCQLLRKRLLVNENDEAHCSSNKRRASSMIHHLVSDNSDSDEAYSDEDDSSSPSDCTTCDDLKCLKRQKIEKKASVAKD